MGYLSDKVNPWILGGTMLFLTSLTTFILWGVLSTSLPGLLTFGIAYGLLAGGWSSSWTGFVRRMVKDENPMGATYLFGYLMFSRGVGNIFSTPISSALSRRNSTGMPGEAGRGHLGFDVAEGRFEKMIVYVGTCFAVASGVALFGWGMEMKGERSRARAARAGPRSTLH
jgi:MFS transporter, MCT family, solute carrier family 16 (monocarboxylic acid transporters), member 10